MMMWQAKVVWKSDEMKIGNGFLSDVEKQLLVDILYEWVQYGGYEYEGCQD
jgi:hypothetical protein